MGFRTTSHALVIYFLPLSDKWKRYLEIFWCCSSSQVVSEAKHIQQGYNPSHWNNSQTPALDPRNLSGYGGQPRHGARDFCRLTMTPRLIAGGQFAQWRRSSASTRIFPLTNLIAPEPHYLSQHAVWCRHRLTSRRYGQGLLLSHSDQVASAGPFVERDDELEVARPGSRAPDESDSFDFLLLLLYCLFQPATIISVSFSSCPIL